MKQEPIKRVVKAEHIQQRINEIKRNLKKAWKNEEQVKILPIYNTLELVEKYLEATK